MPRLNPRIKPHIAAAIEYHRSRPEISFDAHLASLEEELAGEVLAKNRVYLDLRYWIFLRDANLGAAQKAVHVKLLDALASAVERGHVVCPITESVFFELDRQGNTDRRMHTARMIDRLSKGVVIKNMRDRFACEVRDLFEAAIGRRELPKHPCRTVWVRPYSFLGTPSLSGLDDDVQLTFNKAFLSCMWMMSLEDLLTDTPVPDRDGDRDFRETAKNITASSAQHAPAMGSFAQVLDAEICGLIDAHRDEIAQAFRPYLAVLPNADLRDAGGAAPECLNLLYSIMSAKKPSLALPLIQISAGLHAFIRWQRRRPFQFQDIFDLRHAEAAIPYCDVFLTEKFLKTACTSTLLDFGGVFGTRIISDEDEALAVVLKLAA